MSQFDSANKDDESFIALTHLITGYGHTHIRAIMLVYLSLVVADLAENNKSDIEYIGKFTKVGNDIHFTPDKYLTHALKSFNGSFFYKNLFRKIRMLFK